MYTDVHIYWERKYSNAIICTAFYNNIILLYYTFYNKLFIV